MAVKTFSTGEVLTAADTNTYLNNGGLVYIKSQTIGTAVSSVTVTNAFSADYDNYRIVISGGTNSTASSVKFQLSNSTGSTYQMFGYYGDFGTATLTAYSPAAATSWTDAIRAETTRYYATIELNGPFLSVATLGHTVSNSTITAYHFQLRDTSTNSSTGFTLTPNTGTMTGGTIRVYGYRQA